jgi:hypothetical protein
MDLRLSREPLVRNPNCAYCGKVFNGPGVHLQLEDGEKTIQFPLCRSCFDALPYLEATVNLERGLARVKR